MLEDIIAAIMLISLILYALMGGADFGGGMWDLLASGPRAREQRRAIADAIAPIWEANHVWLILVVVLLFTGFPRAFSAMMIALHIPISVMLLGIVFRGTTFVFRKYDSKDDAVQRRWSTIFGISSVFTPFFQGLTLGALTTGEIRFERGMVQTGFFAGWLTPFAIACGFFALALFAFLAAVYLTVDTRHDRDLQHDFRTRALWSQGILLVLAIVVFFTSRHGAPRMYEGLTNWWAPLLLVWTAACAAAATVCLWRRNFQWARVAAVAEVAFILAGWGLAQFPHLVAPDITVHNAAAPEYTLRLLIVALGLGALVLFPSLGWLFFVFKGKQQR